jgi:hypothetical protein
MRLIDAQTLELKLFPDPVREPYAILSHTWTDDEVTFEEMERDRQDAQVRAGFTKITMACHLAVEHGLNYVWVDTCCIDKSSSAELSEAINSMFNWYRNAVMCFAYIYDLPRLQPGANLAGSLAYFETCKWFTRGWTLQELIAPCDVLFYDEDWNLRGSKVDLREQIELITGVDRAVLIDSSLLPTIPIAKRMSWAAKRNTSRVEDLAYCLMGIFDVNMPMIYGEGAKAFVRLQEEILKKTTDLSLFAWQAPEAVHGAEYRGLLAFSPAEFMHCSRVIASDDQFRFREEIRMTNKGMKMNATLQPTDPGQVVMDLDCYRREDNGAETRIGICLTRVLDTYIRRFPEQVQNVEVMPGHSPKPIFLVSIADQRMIHSIMSEHENRRISVQFVTEPSRFYVRNVCAVPQTYWHETEQFFSIYGLNRFIGFVRFTVISESPMPYPNERGETSREENKFTNIILVCELRQGGNLQISLYAQSGLEQSHKPEGFICPFKNIHMYGPLGNPFSLAVLSPGEHQDREIVVLHRDYRLNYVVAAEIEPDEAQPYRFRLKVKIYSQPLQPMQQMQPMQPRKRIKWVNPMGNMETSYSLDG